MSVLYHTFDHEKIAAVSASKLIAKHLNQSPSMICLPGGNSPKPLLEALSQQNIDWSQTYIFPTDERYTHDPNEQNHTLLKQYLTDKIQGKSHLIPLIQDSNQDNNAMHCQQAFDAWSAHFKWAVMGMGLDGHIASIFPECDNFQPMMTSEASFMNSKPKHAPHERITFTFKALLKAQHHMLYIPDKHKYEALKDWVIDPQLSSPVGRLVAYFKACTDKHLHIVTLEN